MFILLALSQAGLLSGLGASAVNFWTAMEFLIGLTASLGVICGLILVFKIEREKRKIRQRIELETRRMGLQSKISLERLDRKPLDKASDFMEAHANKVELAASMLFTTVHLIGLGVLLYSGLSLSGHIKVGGMGVTQITDMVVNALFFSSALMFAVSFWIIHRNKPACSKNVAHQASRLGSACRWDFTGPDKRRYDAHRQPREVFAVEADGGKREGTERLAMLSTHEIRSCFGYQECRLSR
ncbi:hypothetical protein GH714_042982 [Hevea brasiliensis]|uniref:Uncharacterized protein n=1 Tax=Hevea brasiliensis TaxID=3981 RepID=A0A6A6K1X3_HEVBR|nr:hypothetical protein GH714_042982 [Hevea brasiliensis]